MVKKDDMFERAFSTLKQEATATQQQKDAMLNYILMKCKPEDTSAFGKLKRMVFDYPWRFAFAASVVQAVVFTMIFGIQYTNLFLNYYGG